ncbi:hypothetical protein AAHE18_14G058800 [Arachis hypogaea]
MASTAALLLLSLNLLFSTMMVTSQQEPPPPMATPPPPPPSCPVNTIRSSGCLGALNNTIGIGGPSPSSACCSVLGGLVDINADACVCTAIKTYQLPLLPNNTAYVDAVVRACGIQTTPGFQCQPN